MNRSPSANRTLMIVIVAATAIAGCSDDSDGSRAAATVEQTTKTAGTVEPPPTTATPGTGTGFFAGSNPNVAVSFALPAGWVTFGGGWAVIKSDADPIIGVNFFDVGNIYTDPCQWVLADPAVGPTVDDLVSAYARLPGYEAAGTGDVTVDGFTGKHIQYRTPDYDEEECKGRRFAMVQEDNTPDPDEGPSLWAQAPGQLNEAWILDVDGTRLVVSAGYHADTSAQDLADIDEIINSIRVS